jgi:SAM-dependent methyltransferase
MWAPIVNHKNDNGLHNYTKEHMAITIISQCVYNGCHLQEKKMSSDKICRDLEKLRSPERVALLEVDRVGETVLEGIASGSLLDIGTGSGLFAEAFVGRGLAVTGIDTQERMLTAARTHVPNADFRLGSAERLPFPDGSFDIAFLGHVLHESDSPLLVLQEARRVSRQRVSVLEWPFRDEGQGPPMGHRLKPQEIVDYATEAGFRQVTVIPLEHMVLFNLEL